MEAVHLLEVLMMLQTRCEKETLEITNRNLGVNTVKTKAAKLQNLDRHQCRSMMMKTYHHFCGKIFQTENEAYHPACTT